MVVVVIDDTNIVAVGTEIGCGGEMTIIQLL